MKKYHIKELFLYFQCCKKEKGDRMISLIIDIIADSEQYVALRFNKKEGKPLDREKISERELRRLSRADLLELLVAQSRENERLRARLNEANRKLKSREIKIQKAGSIAEAALKLNGVFEAAEQAAQQYIENVCRLAQEEAKAEKAVRPAESEQKAEAAKATESKLKAEKAAKTAESGQEAAEVEDASGKTEDTLKETPEEV